MIIRLQDDTTDKRLDHHMVLPFAGQRISFDELQQLLETRLKKRLTIKFVPWRLFKVLGIFVPLLRDLVDMSYLWNHDIRMDNAALENFMGKTPCQTPLDEAIVSSLPVKTGQSVATS